MDNVNDVKFSVSKFEKMVKENKVIFFDSSEFENIISYYLDSGKLAYAKKALKLSLSQHPFNTNLSLYEIEIFIQEEKFEHALDLINSILIFSLNFNFEFDKISNAKVNNEFPAKTAVDSPNLM